MRVTEDIYKRDFVGEDRKETYLDLCKWLATNFLSAKAGMRDVMYRIVESKKGDEVIFKLIISVDVDESDLATTQCRMCRELHQGFYLNSETCNTCRAQAYRNRLLQSVGAKKQYYRETLRRRAAE